MICNLSLISRITQKFDNLTNPGDFRIGPVELVIDVPFYVGCFEELGDITNLGLAIENNDDSNSPTTCLTKCIESDSTKRYACK